MISKKSNDSFDVFKNIETSQHKLSMKNSSLRMSMRNNAKSESLETLQVHKPIIENNNVVKNAHYTQRDMQFLITIHYKATIVET